MFPAIIFFESSIDPTGCYKSYAWNAKLINKMTATYYLFFLLVLGIACIIWLTAYKKINAFIALLLVALGIGIFSGLPLEKLVATLKAGFGHTMEKIGLLIILGTLLGTILEKTGATTSMAGYILQKVKDKKTP